MSDIEAQLNTEFDAWFAKVCEIAKCKLDADDDPIWAELWFDGYTPQEAADACHAAPPGTGPEGETRKTCDHLARKTMAKTYLKCGLMAAHWTGGGGTDVRAGDPACKHWVALRKGESA